MKTEKIRQGATFEVTATDIDSTVQTFTMTVSNDDGIQAQETAAFSLVDDKYLATIKLDTTDLAVGTYKYMYTVVYDDATVKAPDLDMCKGEEGCGLPDFVVCEANDIEVEP